jgi:hypothetical protein
MRAILASLCLGLCGCVTVVSTPPVVVAQPPVVVYPAPAYAYPPPCCYAVHAPVVVVPGPYWYGRYHHHR